MKGGRRQDTDQGFTIVEVLIVLVVSLFIFISAAVLIQGKAQMTSFDQEVQNLQSQLQAVANDVTNGYYNYSSTLHTKCAVNAVTGVTELPPTGSPTSDDFSCMYLGKVIQFTQTDTFYVYDVLGARQTPGGQLTTTYGNTLPGSYPAYPMVSDDPSLGFMETESLANEMQVQWVRWGTTPPSGTFSSNDIGMVAFLQDPSPNNATPTVDAASAGTVSVNIIPVENTTYTDNSTTAAKFNDYTDPKSIFLKGDTDKNPAGGIQVCLKSLSTNQSDLITLGGVNRKTSIESQIKSGANC